MINIVELLVCIAWMQQNIREKAKLSIQILFKTIKSIRVKNNL